MRAKGDDGDGARLREALRAADGLFPAGRGEIDQHQFGPALDGIPQCRTVVDDAGFGAGRGDRRRDASRKNEVGSERGDEHG